MISQGRSVQWVAADLETGGKLQTLVTVSISSQDTETPPRGNEHKMVALNYALIHREQQRHTKCSDDAPGIMNHHNEANHLDPMAR